MKIWQKYALWYSALTLLYLFPLVRNFSGLAGHGDAWQFVWNIWWIKYAWAHDQSIWHTTMLHWPHGISLILQTFTLASSLPVAGISYVIGIVPAYNLMVMVHFILSGMGMYLLCYHYSKHHLASFIGGFLFAFSPYRFVHYYGHLHLLATEVLLFALLFLIRTLEGKRWSWIGAGLLCALTAYTDLYYFLFLFIVAFALVLWHVPRTKFVVFRLFLIVLIAGALVLPYLITLIKVSHTADFQIPGHDPLMNSNDIKSFFIPGGRSMYEGLTERYWQWWQGWREMGSYVGYSVIVLLLWGLFAGRRSKGEGWWFWMILGVVFAVLSLGPYLHIGGRVIESFRLPYAWLEDALSILKLAGVPSRFFVITSMSLAILVSLSLSKMRSFVAILFLIFLAFEYLPAPVEVSAVSVSPFYETLRQNHEQFAVIDVSDAPAKVLYYQTIHEHPLIGGYTTRPTVSTDRFLSDTPVVRDLFSNTSIDRDPPERAQEILRNLHVRYVLVSSHDLPVVQYVARIGATQEYADDTLRAFRIP